MPKEQINHPQTSKMHYSCALDDPGPCTCAPKAHTDPALFVRWAADGHDRTGNVQVSLLEYAKPAWDEWIDGYGELAAKSERIPVPEPSAEYFSAVLSRSELNDLIRVLRRARDQAYGRDE